MNYYGGRELADAFRTVRRNTIQIAEEIPEDKYDFKPAPDTRTVAQTLAHLAVSTQFQLHVHTNKVTDMGTFNFGELFEKFGAAENQPRTKAELIAYLKEEPSQTALADLLRRIESVDGVQRVRYVSKSDALDSALASFSMAYAARTHDDHAQLVKAKGAAKDGAKRKTA